MFAGLPAAAADYCPHLKSQKNLSQRLTIRSKTDDFDHNYIMYMYYAYIDVTKS